MRFSSSATLLLYLSLGANILLILLLREVIREFNALAEWVEENWDAGPCL